MKPSKVDEVVNPLSALQRLRSAYQTYKYGTTLPKEIEAVKQARLDTAIKKAELKAAKQGKAPAAADDAAAAVAAKPKGIVGKTVDVGKKAALVGTAGAVGYEYLKDPKDGVGTDVAAAGGKQSAGGAASAAADPATTDTGSNALPQGGYSSVRWSKTPATMDRPPEILPPGEFKFQEAAGKVSDEEARLAALQNAIYGQESGYGRAKTDKPNYAGARGPMQIMPKTWEGMKRQGLIPKDWDINNPAHNKAGGDALVKDLYYKYGKDPAKAAAVYYGGPGAIDKQGNIKSTWRDLKNPNAPSALGYSNQVLSRMAGPGPDGKIAAKPPVTTGGMALPAVATTAAVPAAGQLPVQTGGLLDLDKLAKARAAGEDMYDLSRFLKPGAYSGTMTEAKVVLKYYQFLNGNIFEQQSVGSELAKTSGGKFASRADRLDQDKVDAVLGAGKFRAGSREANLALAQHFRNQQDADAGQGARPYDSAKLAVKSAENLTPYTTARDVAGLGALGAAGASMAGRIAPKVASVAAKAVPGLNVAFQGADALRRASIGDTTGSAISAAGAVPVLGIPAIAAQALRDKYRTGSFFPSDSELKAAVDKERDTDAISSTIKEATKNKQKKLVKKITRIKEDLEQVKSSMESKK
jgi:hypothetical protein